jgi:hypothetical protein
MALHSADTTNTSISDAAAMIAVRIRTNRVRLERHSPGMNTTSGSNQTRLPKYQRNSVSQSNGRSIKRRQLRARSYVSRFLDSRSKYRGVRGVLEIGTIEKGGTISYRS